MKFHLGATAFKVHINSQACKVHVGNDLPVMQQFEEFMLTVYWRPGIKDVEITRTASKNPTALLGRIYSGENIYIGDQLSIKANCAAGYGVDTYPRNIIVEGNTTIYIEPNGETSIDYAQEIYLPNDYLIEVTPEEQYTCASVSADFDLCMIWNNMHWSNNLDFAYIIDTPVDLYELPGDWYYDLQQSYEQTTGESFSMSTEQQAAYIRQNGLYLGTIWISYHDRYKHHLWHISYNPGKHLSSDFTQEIHFNNGYSIAVSKEITNPEEGRDFDAFCFTADFAAQLLCNGCHWGSYCIDVTYPTKNTPIDLYELDTYDDPEYLNVMSEGNSGLEALYISTHGKYIGSLYVDNKNCWVIVYREDLQ